MVRGQVRTRLLAICAAEQVRAEALHAHYGRLWQAITQQVASGGKYLRPYIVFLTYNAYGGNNPESIIDEAATWELLHIGLLMHDDVIDRDYIRHGRPNVAGQYLELYGAGREHQAQSAGLLAGDLVLAAARRLLINPQLVAIFDEAYATVIGGELLDMEASLLNKPANLQLIAETKTASYSLIGPLLTGAILGGADDSELLQIREVGRVLGIGFQLADDLLVFGKDSQIGKSADSDLAEGKRTMVIAEALTRMSLANREQTESLLHNPSSAHVPALRKLISQTDTLNLLRNKLTDTAEQARTLIKSLDIKDDSRTSFDNLVTQLLARAV